MTTFIVGIIGMIILFVVTQILIIGFEKFETCGMWLIGFLLVMTYVLGDVIIGNIK